MYLPRLNEYKPSKLNLQYCNKYDIFKSWHLFKFLSMTNSSIKEKKNMKKSTYKYVRHQVFQEIKKRLLLGIKAMNNWDSILKRWPTKVPLVKAMIFPVIKYGCESWTTKKAEHQRIDDLELRCWRRLLRVPWTARKSNQSILKEISPKHSLEGLMLNSNPLATWCKELTRWKRPWCWERLKAGGDRDDRG